MSIGINGGSPFGGVQTSGPIQGLGLRQDKDGDHDASSRVSGPSRGGLMQNVVQSLNSLGLSSTSQVISPTSGQEAQQAMHSFMHSLHQALQQTGGQTSIANKNSTASQPAAKNPVGDNQDTQIQSVNLSNNSALKKAQAAYGNNQNNATAPAMQSVYGSLDGNLQNLLNNVKSNSSNPTVADLNSKFSNLVQTLKGGQSAGNSQPTSPSDLQSFLQDMIQNTHNPLDATGLGSSGNLLSIRA